MWILIIWMFSTYDTQAVSMTTQEFTTESACRTAFVKVKELNASELSLRGVCTPKDK